MTRISHHLLSRDLRAVLLGLSLSCGTTYYAATKNENIRRGSSTTISTMAGITTMHYNENIGQNDDAQ